MSQEFNYHGLDEKGNDKIYMQNLRDLEDFLREKYYKRLEAFNKSNLEQNPSPFRFLNRENCTLLFILVPKELDEKTASEIYILSTPNERQEIFKILTQEDLADVDSYRHHHIFFSNKILPSLGFDSSQVIFNLSDAYNSFHYGKGYTLFESNFDINHHYGGNKTSSRIIRVIQEETTNFKNINETKLSYFAKDAYKFPFSLFDLRPLVELVNDNDFSYQLDQAMAAYHQNLFLPSAATLGVVLETLCMKVLEINQINSKPSDTQLSKLIEKLRNEKIITRRDQARLEVAYRMRNITAHTSPGAILKEDCHFMLNVINSVAHEYLKEAHD